MCLTTREAEFYYPRDIQTLVHTTYVEAPPKADGRIPRRGFTNWLPTAVGLRPTRGVS
jgi:hypothetical protein